MKRKLWFEQDNKSLNLSVNEGIKELAIEDDDKLKEHERMVNE